MQSHQLSGHILTPTVGALVRGHRTSNIHVLMFGDVRYFLNNEMFDVPMFAYIQMFESSNVRMFANIRMFVCSLKSLCPDFR